MKRMQFIKYVCSALVFFGIAFALACLVGTEWITALGPDFQYAILTTGATLLGFIITDISVLFACMSNTLVGVLWQCNYLDNTYRAALSEAKCCLAMIVTAIICLVVGDSNDKILNAAEFVELIAIFACIYRIVICIKELAFVIKTMRENPDVAQLLTHKDNSARL